MFGGGAQTDRDAQHGLHCEPRGGHVARRGDRHHRQPAGAGTAAAATYLLKERSAPSLTNQEDTGVLAEKLRDESDTQKYNRYSAPTTPGVTRMSRLFLYPGEWPEDEVARAVLIQIEAMEAELSTRSRQVVIDSYYTYTYTYSVSVQQAYGDQNTAWVVGIGIDQTAKEEHKT